MRTDYNAKIRYSSKELSAKERIMLKDTGNATKLDTLLEDGAIEISVDYYAIVDIHNEKAKQDKDYSQIVIVDKAGNKFTSGSNSLIEAISDMADELADEGIEEFTISIFRKPSKNYTGKYFITCSLV